MGLMLRDVETVALELQTLDNRHHNDNTPLPLPVASSINYRDSYLPDQVFFPDSAIRQPRMSIALSLTAAVSKFCQILPTSSPKLRNRLSSSLPHCVRHRTNMAWHSSGASNDALIENLFQNGLITSLRVREAMKKVDVNAHPE